MDEVVGRSATAARLLALLTSTPGKEFHTRDLVRRVGGTERPVHLALEKLERRGLIQSRYLARLRLWRMEPKHPLYAPLRELYAKTVGIAARLREVLTAEPGIELAFIYGSYVGGQDDTTSDIDVFVLGKPDWERLSSLTRHLLDEFGREVNVVAWTERDLARALERGSGFFETIKEQPKMWILGDDDELQQRSRRLGSAVQGSDRADTAKSARSRSEAGTRRSEPGARPSRPRRG